MKPISPLPVRSVAVSTLCLLMAGAVHAQPNVDNGAKADNPTNRAPRPDRANMTPEQRIAARLLRQFTQAGATDAATQEKLMAYVADEVKARTTLLEKARQLQTGLRGGALSDTQVVALLNTYQASVEEDKARRLKAEAELKKALDLTKMPKVEATLTLLGLLGDGPSLLGGAMAGGNARGANQGANGNAARPNRARPKADNQTPAGAEVQA